MMDTDGAHLQRLTNNPLRDEMPEWSPNGMQIVYSSEHEDGMEIYLINRDGTGRRRLTNRAGNDWFPTWAPDGRQILWMSQGVNTGQLWIMNADGSNQRPLTGVLPYLGRARWSPDGRYIVFSYLSRPEEAVNLGIVNADGTNLHEVRCPTAYVHVGFTVGAWTPDGESLLVTQYRPQEVNTAPENVVTMVHLTNGVCDNNSLDLYHNLSAKLLTDMTRADPWPPISALAPVPRYTRLPNLILHLSGQDVGRSGLRSYDVHYRMAGDGDWKKGEDHMPAIVVLRPPTAGPIVLRSRARDMAGNEEAWPTFPETSTLLYRSLLQGQYTDQRGIPLADQVIAIGPVPLEEGRSDTSGAFRVHVGGVNYTVNSTMRLPTDSDWTRDLYRIPADNLLTNGTFEASSLARWQTSGDPAPQIDQDVVYNGSYSLRLGAACVGICPPPDIPEFIPHCIPNVMPGCVDPEAAFPPNYVLSTVRFFADSKDNLHFIGNTISGDILYQHGQPQGSWDRPIILDSALDLGSLRGVVHTNGDLHLVWSSSEGKLYYRKRSNDSTWSSSREIGSGTAPEIAIDSKGLVHLLYTSVQPHQSMEQSLHYRQQNADGSWSAPTDIARYLYNYLSLPVLYHTIAITADDRVHLAWDKPEGESSALAFQLVYKVREANGRWGGEVGLGRRCHC
ncbi:MAG: hypothetical protein R2867_22060 [Caldilineaceae bacterium]